MRTKKGDIRFRVHGNMMALVWKDKQDIHMLMNMHNPPTEVNFCDEYGNAIKPAIEDYKKQELCEQERQGHRLQCLLGLPLALATSVSCLEEAN